MSTRDPIRVLLVYGQIDLGGIEMDCLEHCRGFDRSRYETEMLYYCGSHVLREEFLKTSCKLTFMDKQRIGRLRFILRLAKYIRRGRYDIIHCYSGTALFYGRWAAILDGHPTIVCGDHYGEPPTRLTRLLRKVGNGRTVGWKAISRGCRRQLIETFGILTVS